MPARNLPSLPSDDTSFFELIRQGAYAPSPLSPVPDRIGALHIICHAANSDMDVLKDLIPKIKDTEVKAAIAAAYNI